MEGCPAVCNSLAHNNCGTQLALFCISDSKNIAPLFESSHKARRFFIHRPVENPLVRVFFVGDGGLESYRFCSGCMTASSFGRNCRQPFLALGHVYKNSQTQGLEILV